MTAIHVAVVGCGGIAAFTHIPQLLSDSKTVTISYLCDTKPERIQALQTRYGITSVRTTDDYRDIVRDHSVDAVILSAWPTANSRIAPEVLRSGKHLLVQKPLMLSKRQCSDLIKFSEESKRQVLALPHVEMLEQFSKLKEKINDGQIGEIQFARIRIAIPGPRDYYADVCRFFQEPEAEPPFLTNDYARSRGCLSDMGPYALTVLHFLFGEGKCIASAMSAAEYEKVAVLTLSLENGKVASPKKPPICTIEIGWSQADCLELCSVFGSAGSFCIEVNGRTVLRTAAGIEEIFPAGVGSLLPMSPFQAQRRWLSAIRDGVPPQFQDTVGRAVWVAGLIDEAYRVDRVRRVKK